MRSSFLPVLTPAPRIWRLREEKRREHTVSLTATYYLPGNVLMEQHTPSLQKPVTLLLTVVVIAGPCENGVLHKWRMWVWENVFSLPLLFGHLQKWSVLLWLLPVAQAPKSPWRSPTILPLPFSTVTYCMKPWGLHIFPCSPRSKESRNADSPILSMHTNHGFYSPYWLGSSSRIMLLEMFRQEQGASFWDHKCPYIAWKALRVSWQLLSHTFLQSM